MKRSFAMASVFVLLAFGSALAMTGSSIEPSNVTFGDMGDRDNILVIETTTSFLPQAMTELAVDFDYYYGSDFSGLDLSGYAHVFVGMDGGTVEEPSIVNVAAYVGGGGHLHFFGGTCWQPFAIAVDAHLTNNNVNDYCWAISGAPHFTVTDAGHYLAFALPGSYNFSNASAAYYSHRNTDAGAMVAATNGDGYSYLFNKMIGPGNFDWCISSAYESYWTDPGDHDVGLQIVSNMLYLGPTATEEGSWSSLKSLY